MAQELVNLKNPKYSPMSRDEERKLFIEYEKTKDPAIKNIIVERNLKFAMSFARKYARDDNEMAYELLNEAVSGLIKAVDRFDVSTGHKFITYAVWWMKQHVNTFIRKNKEIYIPCQKNKNTNKDVDDEGEVEENNSESSNNEVNQTEIKFTFANIDSESEDGGLVFNISQETFSEPDEDMSLVDANILLSDLLKKIDNRSRMVLTNHYGYGVSCEDIARRYGMSKQTIYTIRNRAINKLKNVGNVATNRLCEII